VGFCRLTGILSKSCQVNNVTNREKRRFIGQNRMPDWQEVDEEQLISRAKAGESDAFGELYERFVPPVYRFLYARLDDRQDAEDLAEEVFIRVWRSISSYQEQGVPFISYLFTVARHVLIDHYRSVGRKGRQESIDGRPLQDHHADPSEVAIANLENQEIRRVLDKLRDDYRMVLVLRFLSELSPEEVAQVMGRSTGAVRVLQYRALISLRNLLEGA
jgi:RNA polymerase sigma-70 factor (ECF subfamily)